MLLSGPNLVTFMLATLAVMATPGVTVSALVGTTLSNGTRFGFGVEAGALVARLSMILLLALGLDAVSRFMGVMFDVVKLMGAAYLVWLGIKTIRHPPDIFTGEVDTSGLPAQMLRGIIVLWGNPKALIFFGAFLPQFVDTSGNVAAQVMFLGLIWLATAFTTDSCYILLAGKARGLFRGDFARRLGWISGAVLIAAGVWLALQRPH